MNVRISTQFRGSTQSWPLKSVSVIRDDSYVIEGTMFAFHTLIFNQRRTHGVLLFYLFLLFLYILLSIARYYYSRRKYSITFYKADRVACTALLIDPDDCKLGRRLETDRRAIIEAIEKARDERKVLESRDPHE